MAFFKILKDALSGRDFIAEITAANNAVADLKSRNKTLNAQIATEIGKYDSEKSAHTVTKRKLTVEKNSHTETKQKLESEKQAHHETRQLRSNDYLANQRAIQQLQQDCDNKEQQIRRLEQEISELQTEKQRLNTELEHKLASIQGLNNDINSFQEELTSAQAQLNRIQHDLDNANDSIAAKESELRTIREQLETKVNELDVANNQIETLTNQLNNARTSEEVVRELERQIQKLNESISIKNSQIDDKTHTIEEAERELTEIISQLNNFRRENSDLAAQVNSQLEKIQTLEVENNLLKERIAALEATTVHLEPEPLPATEPEPAPVYTAEPGLDPVPITEPEPEPEHLKGIPTRVTIRRQAEIESLIANSTDGVNFPLIVNEDNHATRSIEFVYDEHGERIYADKFFGSDNPIEEIARISRMLAGADIIEDSLWTCGCCKNPVKIAHRKINGKESLFFIHATRNPECDWSKISTAPTQLRKPVEEIISDEFPTPKAKEIKEFIYNILISSTSQNAGISDVKKDSPISSNLPYMKWRRPDISFMYNGRQVVLELLKPRQNLTSIVDLDMFCSLNNIQIIWLFFGQNESTYDYMKLLNYKDSLFDNHRNVFVFDKDVREECTERDAFVLKCNWLNPDNKWEITLEKNGTNGKLISLSDLTFDEEYCKPYFFDANGPYFSLHPDAKKRFEDSRKSREELLTELEYKWTRDVNYKDAQAHMRQNHNSATLFEKNGLWGFRYKNTILIQPIFSPKPREIAAGHYVVNLNGKSGIVNCFGQKIINWDGRFACDDIDFDQTNNRVYIKENNSWGVADVHGRTLISPKYTAIKAWTSNAYRVKQNGLWGICDINGTELCECIYEEIDELSNGKALASLIFEGEWHPRQGYINQHGKQMPTSRTYLSDNFHKEQWFGLWGLYSDNGDCLLHPKYDNVLPWHEKLFRICLKGKWGVIDIDSKELIIPTNYNSIGDVINGISVAKLGNTEHSFDMNGNEVAEHIIELRDGFKKIRKSGKWGIVAPNGSEIIAPLYDEIGSFRCRFIGIINGRIIKLDANYNYPIFISAKYIETKNKSYIFNIAGVNMSIPKSMFNAKGQSLSVLDGSKMYHKFAFGNIMFIEQRCILRLLKNENLGRTLSHGDSNSSFALNETVEVTITQLKRFPKFGKLTTTKLIAQTDDGRVTMIPSRFFRASGKDINDYTKDDKIVLRKTGFDDELDQTIWEIVKRE